jgi:hypothetical protein
MSNKTIHLPPLVLAVMDAYKEPQKEDRRSSEIRTSFYDKLAALDAGSIAVAASIGIALIAKPELRSASLHANASWLVVITIMFWVSLFCAITHNFLAVKIAELESAYSHDEFCKTMVRKIVETIENNATAEEQSEADQADQVVKLTLGSFTLKQQHNVKRRHFLHSCSTTLGYISMGSFLAAYTLVMARVVCLWWVTR